MDSYNRKTDEELLRRMHNGDKKVIDYLMVKYKNLVRKKAIRDYQEEKDSSFYHFAEICISRQMYTAMEASQRKKHAPLNSYVSLDEEPDNDGQIPLTEVLQSLTNGNPEDMVIDQENVEAFQKKIEKCLSKMEKEVLALTLQGLDYHQVAQIMDKSPKSIDNALQRIKGKLR